MPIREITHYVLIKPWAVYVKEAWYFRKLGGRKDDWGKGWEPLTATNHSHAYGLADKIKKERYPNGNQSKPSF